MSRLLFSSHHLYPKSRNGVGHGPNMVRLVHSFHNRWHVLFNNMTPDEQLGLWAEVNEPILTKETREKVGKILECPEFMYINGILRPRYETDKN